MLLQPEKFTVLTLRFDFKKDAELLLSELGLCYLIRQLIKLTSINAWRNCVFGINALTERASHHLQSLNVFCQNPTPAENTWAFLFSSFAKYYQIFSELLTEIIRNVRVSTSGIRVFKWSDISGSRRTTTVQKSSSMCRVQTENSTRLPQINSRAPVHLHFKLSHLTGWCLLRIQRILRYFNCFSASF